MGVESIREQPELLVARLLGYKGKGSWQRQSHASTGILWFHHRFLVYLRPVQLITHQWISGARVSRLCQSQRDVYGERDGFVGGALGTYGATTKCIALIIGSYAKSYPGEHSFGLLGLGDLSPYINGSVFIRCISPHERQVQCHFYAAVEHIYYCIYLSKV